MTVCTIVEDGIVNVILHGTIDSKCTARFVFVVMVDVIVIVVPQWYDCQQVHCKDCQQDLLQ